MQQAFGIIHSFDHGLIDVLGGADLPENRICGLVDQHGEDALKDLLSQRPVLPRRRIFCTGAVIIMAPTGFPAQVTRFHQALLGKRRAIARIVEEGSKNRFGNGIINIVADKIHQLERPHTEAADLLHCPVDGGDIGHSLLQQAQRLPVKRPGDTVDDETGGIFRQHSSLAPAIDQPAGRLHDICCACHPGDDLHQRHQRCGIEKMRPEHPLRLIAGGTDSSYRQ